MEPGITTIAANGLEFACLTDGPEDGPLALCLHGFPDSAHTWRYLLPELAAAGFHAVAPFLRGYAPTPLAPDGRYQVGALVQDANALHEVLGGGDDAVLLGHDWGALATYGAVAHQPARWRRAVAAAVPPTASIGMSLLTYAQLQKSWYMFFFLSPLAEAALPLDDYAFLADLWRDWSPGYDGAWDVARVKESIGDPERIVAAISYYRAMWDPTLQVPELADEQAAVLAPTIVGQHVMPVLGLITVNVPLAVGLIYTEPVGALAEKLFTEAGSASGAAAEPTLAAVESSTSVL